MNRWLAYVIAILVVLVAAPAAVAAPAPGSGAPGSGDPYFPLAGNGGYDVAHYGLRLVYSPGERRPQGPHDGHRDGDAGPDAVRPRPARLHRLEGPRRRGARDLLAQRPGARDRAGGGHRRRGFVPRRRELRRPAARDHRPRRVHRGLGAHERRRLRRRRAPRLSRLVRGQRQTRATRRPTTSRSPCPAGSPSWPTACSCPAPPARRRVTWRWHEGDPMAPYLATATVGRFDLTTRDVDGVPSYVAVDKQLAGRKVLSKLPAIVRYYASIYGAVPVRRRRRHRRPRPERRLRARDADQAGLRLDARRAHAGARAGAPVVRRLGHARAVAGHLAQRGVRDLVGVDLDRAPRRGQRPPDVREAVRDCRRPRSGCGPSRPATRARPPSCSETRPTSAAP